MNIFPKISFKITLTFVVLLRTGIIEIECTLIHKKHLFYLVIYSASPALVSFENKSNYK